MHDPSTQGRVALVVEGGGMRGVFTAGVLDAFLEAAFDPFDLYFGVSSGACNLASHLAGQHLRNVRVYTGIMARPAFLSFLNFMRGGSWMDLDYLWRAFEDEEPLDVSAIFRREKCDFTAVGTSAKTGGPLYMRPRAGNCLAVVKASSALPFLYRGRVEIDGERVLDGGISDPIPAEEAYRRGARRIVVLRTRPASYRKNQGLEHALSAFAVRTHPALSQAVKSQPATYTRCLDFLERPPEGVEIFQIAPDVPLATGRTTQRVETLLADYEIGKKLGAAFAARYGQ